MKRVSATQRLLITLAVPVLLSLGTPRLAGALPLVNPGFNLFVTQPVTNFFLGGPGLVDFEGVPLPCFDFGDGNGCVGVGNADTIVSRIDPAFDGGGVIEIVALSLVSVNPVDIGLGAGIEDVFVDLNLDRGSSMTINFGPEGQPHGAFASVLTFSFDVVGSVGGVYFTAVKTLTATAQDWQHAPTTPNMLIIDGVNRLLNGLDETNDFSAIGLVLHDDGLGTAIHTAKAAAGNGAASRDGHHGACIVATKEGIPHIGHRTRSGSIFIGHDCRPR